jgi:hypothetical protein
MLIYLAGIPAGWSDHVDWKTTEQRLCEEMGCVNRLHSFFYLDHLEGYLEFRKELRQRRGVKKAELGGA